jgi:hypothetical protein
MTNNNSLSFIDQLVDEEIALLNAKISDSSYLYKDLISLFNQTQSVSSSLTLANEYLSNKDYINAYKAFLHSLNYLTYINEQILEKYISVQQVLKNND